MEEQFKLQRKPRKLKYIDCRVCNIQLNSQNKYKQISGYCKKCYNKNRKKCPGYKAKNAKRVNLDLFADELIDDYRKLYSKSSSRISYNDIIKKYNVCSLTIKNWYRKNADKLEGLELEMEEIIPDIVHEVEPIKPIIAEAKLPKLPKKPKKIKQASATSAPKVPKNSPIKPKKTKIEKPYYESPPPVRKVKEPIQPITNKKNYYYVDNSDFGDVTKVDKTFKKSSIIEKLNIELK
jgi:hypothetical protein